jgi:hypothetical protein
MLGWNCTVCSSVVIAYCIGIAVPQVCDSCKRVRSNVAFSPVTVGALTKWYWTVYILQDIMQIPVSGFQHIPSLKYVYSFPSKISIYKNFYIPPQQV